MLISISCPSSDHPAFNRVSLQSLLGPHILSCTSDTGFLFACTKAATPDCTQDGSIPSAPSKVPLRISVVSFSSTLLYGDCSNPSFPSQKWLLRMTFPARCCWARSPLSFAGPSHSLTGMQFIHQYSAFLSIHLWIFSFSFLFCVIPFHSVHPRLFFTLVIVECLQWSACGRCAVVVGCVLSNCRL